MEFFVSWTSRDPVFQEYDNEANILISPHFVNHSWTIENWKTTPARLFIDSGAYSVNERHLSVEEVLKRQIHIGQNWPTQKPLYFSHPDLIIPLGLSFSGISKRIKESNERAKKYITFIRKRKIKCKPVGVIHGFDEETILLSYQELLDVGYRYFAIGSLAIRITHSNTKCLKTIRTVCEVCKDPVHLFGILVPFHSFSEKVRLTSFDSAAPAKLGYFGTVLYGPQLNHFIIAPNAKQRMRDKLWKFRKAIDEPLPCNCPICTSNYEKLNAKNDNQSKANRIVHNYFQVKWATQKIT